MTTPALDRPRLLAARNAVYAVFTVNGLAFASWASRIPDAKATLNLSPGQLGVVLLFASAGSIVGLPMAGHIVHRIGAADASGALRPVMATIAGLGASAATGLATWRRGLDRD